VLATAAAVTLVAGAGGAVAATAGGSSNVLHACSATAGGALRLIKAGQQCNSNETAVSWNKTGPMGPMGGTGPAGPAGPAGVSGYVMNENQFSVAAYTGTVQDLQCPTNKVLTGGGLTLLSPQGNPPGEIESDGPVNSTTWEVSVFNPDNLGNTVTFGEWIMCATAS
jgi:hypothetical protein